MKKYIILGVIGLMLVFSFSTVLAAKPVFQVVDASNSITGEVKNTIGIPSQAVGVAPGLFYLGEAVDPGSGKLVEGYAIIKYKKGFGKPGTKCGNGICEPGENINKCPQDCGGDTDPEPDTSFCYGFLAKDAKWKTVEDWMVDPTNSRGMDEAFIAQNLADDIAKWELEAGADILGNQVAGIVNGADTVSPDDKNEVLFGDIDSPGAIGVTIIWGIFGGRPSNRVLVEWDQVYDDVDFDWSASGELDKMDFESIATHELGHSMGMGDLYTAECSDETMYGYATEGETKKRDLNMGDIAGINILY